MQHKYFVAFSALAIAALMVTLPGQAAVQVLPEPTIDPDLQAVVDSVVRGFRGEVGVYVQHIPSGRSAEVRADVVFPSASLIKVPILINTVRQIEKGVLDIDAAFPFRDTLRTAGSGLLAGFRDGEMVTIREMMLLMSSASDNTAALWLQQLGGSGAVINSWLDDHGYEKTKVNAGTPGRKRQWKQYNWGQTTPREIARLFIGISEGNVVGPEGSRMIHNMLSRSFLDSEGLSPLPQWVKSISKQGSVERSRSEVILVYSPSGPYVFAVLTKNIKDLSWSADNEAFTLLRSLSAELWQFFEVGD
ncbi:MAG: serine hydrolase [Rhodothermales bacterium]|nr:serine hydrolase [Rhodothermales bacterium]